MNLYGMKTVCYYVDSENPYMTAVDGVLYSKDMTQLICYPPLKGLKEFVIPNSVFEIGDYAFAGYLFYLKNLIFNDNIESIPSGFLDGLRGKLSYLKLSNKIKIIDIYFFKKSIKKLILPKKLEKIEGYCYSGTVFDKTSDITIYDSKIANLLDEGNQEYIFTKFIDLVDFHVCDSTPVALVDNAFSASKYFTINLYVPKGTKEIYQNTDGWKNFYNIIEEDTQTQEAYYDFMVSANKGGKVSFLNKSIENDSYITTVKQNEDVKILIESNNGWKLKSLIVNGVDVTEYIEAGAYIVNKIKQNTRIDVKFEELPHYLTIKSADNGFVSQEVEPDKNYTFEITPNEGWLIESVSFNGQDVTNQMDGSKYTTPIITYDSELNIVYKRDDSSINMIANNQNINVSASNGKVYIKNNGRTVDASVYNLSGSVVAMRKIEFGTSSIELPENNIYIVKVDNVIYKIAV